MNDRTSLTVAISTDNDKPRVDMFARSVDGRLTWTVQYRLPFKLLQKYYSTLAWPDPGLIWRANFYKCADLTFHPHWITWVRIDNPVADFHIPRFFGIREFQ